MWKVTDASHASHACFSNQFPRLEIALCRGNRIVLGGRFKDPLSHSPNVHELENLKPKRMVHLRWDPLINAYMIVKNHI
jgi:hypothetical protein